MYYNAICDNVTFIFKKMSNNYVQSCASNLFFLFQIIFCVNVLVVYKSSLHLVCMSVVKLCCNVHIMPCPYIPYRCIHHILTFIGKCWCQMYYIFIFYWYLYIDSFCFMNWYIYHVHIVLCSLVKGILNTYIYCFEL